MSEVGKPKILIYDVEATGLNADWGTQLCFGYEWYGTDQPKVVSVLDTNKGEGYFIRGREKRVDTLSDSKLMEATRAILLEADLLVSWYGREGRGFDSRFINARLLAAGLPPLPRLPQVDLHVTMRDRFKLGSNRLANVQRFMRLEAEKTPLDMYQWQLARVGDVKGIKYVTEHCLAPEHKALTADLRWVPIGDLRVGDKLVGFDEHSTNYSRRYRTAIVTTALPRILPRYTVELSSGEVFHATVGHKWLVGTHNERGLGWVKTENLRFHPNCSSTINRLFPMWEHDTSNDAGWLAGFLDGEGSCTKRGAVSFGQRPGVVLENAIRVLNEKDQEYALRLTCETSCQGIGKKDCMSGTLSGWLGERLKFLGSIRPHRLLEKISPDHFGRIERWDHEERGEDSRVVTVREEGLGEIVELGTSTGTFIADGFPVHNCKADVAVLREAYTVLRPWVHLHPRVQGYQAADGTPLCPTCGKGTLRKAKTRMTRTKGLTWQYQCQECGGYDTRPAGKEG